MKRVLDFLEREATLNRRDFLKMALTTFVLPSFLSGCFKKARQRTLTFFNWSNYIGKKTIPNFEKETGVKVKMDFFSDEEEMFAKLKTGIQGYDLIVATDYMIPRLKGLNLIDAIPQDKLKNLGNLDPNFTRASFDPGLVHTVPYLWGTTGIGYNKKYIKNPPRSWRDLWNPEYKGKISMLDNVRDGIGCTLLLLGLPIDSKDPQHLKKVRDFLVQQKPLLKHYSSTTYMDELIAGEIWLCQGWNGDVLQASKENPELDYAIPQEGSFMYVDSLCLIRGSEHREETLSFIDFILRPEVAAEISNTMHYANANAKAKPFLDPALSKDLRVFPSAQIQKRLRFYAGLDEETERAWNKVWQEVKVG
ncbi:MAG: spermidine/putrescine ABC transporter substrate-binding protein [Elusimicrobia bacterium]|nr:spermidine/putrescine ABC transporter substrate-binding protein [Elusimicrobiota bacterium]